MTTDFGIIPEDEDDDKVNIDEYLINVVIFILINGEYEKDVFTILNQFIEMIRYNAYYLIPNILEG